MSSEENPIPQGPKSGVKGVTWYKKIKKWVVKIRVEGGKEVYLGAYSDLDEAIAVRKKAELQYPVKTKQRRRKKPLKKRTSGHRGVTWYTNSQVWVAYISRFGQKHYLGNYKKLADAVRARKAAETFYDQAKPPRIEKQSSGCRGVFWNKHSQAWDVRISINGKSVYISQYKNLDEAVKIRKKAEADKAQLISATPSEIKEYCEQIRKNK